MTTDFEQKLLSGVAYKIFSEELHKHLAATTTLFALNEWTPEQVREAVGRFHTIRGGAGFFKFTTLAATAGELEAILQRLSLAELAGEIARLRDLHNELNCIAAQLPAPIQG